MSTHTPFRVGPAPLQETDARPRPLRQNHRRAAFALLALAFSLLLPAFSAQAQNLFIANYNYGKTPNTLVRVSQSNGALVGTQNTPNVGSFSNIQIAHILMGPDGNVYAPTFNSGSLLRFNGATGAYMGLYNTQFSIIDGLTCVAVGSDGNMYAGTNIGVIKIGGPNNGSPGTNYGYFGNSADQIIAIVFDPACNMLAITRNNSTNVVALKKYSPQGTSLGNLITFGANDNPQSMAIGPDRNHLHLVCPGRHTRSGKAL